MGGNKLACSSKSKRISYFSILFSVEEEQRTEACLGFTRAECFNSPIQGCYGSPVQCYFTATLNFLVKLGHYSMKIFLWDCQCSGKSWQHLVPTFWEQESWLIKKREAPLI